MANNNNKVPNLVLSIFVCLLLLLFHGSLATQFQQQDQKCQLNRLEAVESNNRIVAEAGVIHTWNPNHDQFQCAGVALVRYVFEYKGFLLPSYSNAPQFLLVLGRGILGVVLPAGCQKLLHLRGGEAIVIPAGVAYWLYSNDRDEPLVTISLLRTGNQLNDPIPRRFYLAGNPEDEFAPYRQQQQQQQQSSSANNVFGGFDTHRLADSLNLNVDTIRKLQGDSNDNRKNIVRVDLDTTTPINNRQHSDQGSQSHERGDDDDANNASIDGDDIYSCSVKLKQHMALDSEIIEVYTPRGGYIFNLNSSNFPILKHLQLSVESGSIFPRGSKNSSYVPHWNTNAHSVIYALESHAQVQVVNDKGERVFDGEFRGGQVLMVPQNYAVVVNCYEERFFWVAFKTNENAVKTTLAGPNSFIGTLPEGVLRSIYNLSRDELENVKNNRRESTLLSTSS